MYFLILIINDEQMWNACIKFPFPWDCKFWCVKGLIRHLNNGSQLWWNYLSNNLWTLINNLELYWNFFFIKANDTRFLHVRIKIIKYHTCKIVDNKSYLIKDYKSITSGRVSKKYTFTTSTIKLTQDILTIIIDESDWWWYRSKY